MTIMKAGGALFLAGMAIIVFGSRAELRLINEALTRRLKTGIGLSLGGIVVILVGARVQGQIYFRSLKRKYQPQIDQLKKQFDRLRPLIKAATGKAGHG